MARKNLLAPIGAVAAACLLLATPTATAAEPPVEIAPDAQLSGSVLGGGVIQVQVEAQIPEDTTFVTGSIASGITALLTQNGWLYTTGANDQGQLGLGDYEDRDSLHLVNVPNKGTAEFVFASSAQTMWTGSNVWGNNSYNQYGADVPARNAPDTYEAALPEGDSKPNPSMLAPTKSASTVPGGVSEPVGNYSWTDGSQYFDWYFQQDHYVGLPYSSQTRGQRYCPASRPYTSPWLAASPAALFEMGTKTHTQYVMTACTVSVDKWYSPYWVALHESSTGVDADILPAFPETTELVHPNVYGGKAYELPDGLFTSIDTKGRFGAAISVNGVLYTWGDSATGALGYVDATGIIGLSSPISVPVDPADKLVKVVTGWDYALALSEAGDVFAWGQNGNGQLGTGDTDPRITPVKVASGMKDIFASDNTHSMALDIDGHAWTWGNNSRGELGLGDNDDRLSPTRIVPLAEPPILTAHFGDTPATVMLSSPTPNEDGKWLFDIHVPEHIAGAVPISLTVAGESFTIGTYTYTFPSALRATPADTAPAKSQVTIEAYVTGEEASRPELVSGAPYELTGGTTRSTTSSTFGSDGVAILGSVTSQVPAVMDYSGGSPADETELTNSSEIRVTFTKVPVTEPTDPPKRPIPTPTPTPGPKPSEEVASTGFDAYLAGGAFALIVAGGLVFLLTKRTKNSNR